MPSQFSKMTVHFGCLVLPQNADIMTLCAYIDVYASLVKLQDASMMNADTLSKSIRITRDQ